MVDGQAEIWVKTLYSGGWDTDIAETLHSVFTEYGYKLETLHSGVSKLNIE